MRTGKSNRCYSILQLGYRLLNSLYNIAQNLLLVLHQVIKLSNSKPRIFYEFPLLLPFVCLMQATSSFLSSFLAFSCASSNYN
jgi:hypothetical protein